jgi:hypothetical protein
MVYVGRAERGRVARHRAAFRSGVREFPGKALANELARRLFISETNHHRILAGDTNTRRARVLEIRRPGSSQ